MGSELVKAVAVELEELVGGAFMSDRCCIGGHIFVVGATISSKTH